MVGMFFYHFWGMGRIAREKALEMQGLALVTALLPHRDPSADRDSPSPRYLIDMSQISFTISQEN